MSTGATAATTAPATTAPAATAPAAEPAPVEMMPTPYTAREIRDANPPGTQLAYRVEEADADPIRRIMKFLKSESGNAVLETLTLRVTGEPIGFPQRSEATWEELRDHALFPADGTTRTRSKVTVPAGEFDTWLYTVTASQAGVTSTTLFHFADDRPGPPVLLESRLGDRVVSRMILTGDSRGR